MRGARARIAAAVGAAVLLLSACTDTSEKPAPPARPPGSHWVALPDAPAKRQEVAAALVGDTAWIVGGLTESGTTARVDSFDVKTSTWRPGPPLPVAVHHAMAAAFDGALVVAGGFDAQSRATDRVFKLLPGSAWIELPKLNRPRAAGVMVQTGSGKDLYVFGGAAGGKTIAAPERLVLDAAGAPSRWADVAPMPTPRHHLSAAVFAPYVYLAGGRVPSASGGDHNVTAFERYDLTKNSWQSLPAIPMGRSGHGSAYVTIAGKAGVVLIGGEDPLAGGPSISLVDVFDVAGSKWYRPLPHMFRARHGIGVVQAGQKVYVFLGGSRAGLAPTAVSDVLDVG